MTSERWSAAPPDDLMVTSATGAGVRGTVPVAARGNQDAIATVWETLAAVHDPCSEAIGCPLSLVDMQIVRSVVESDAGLTVTLQLTEPSCIFAFHIAEEVESRLRSELGPDHPFEVRLAHDYPEVWTEDAILPDARARLEEFRARRTIPLTPVRQPPLDVEPTTRRSR